jgi:hypothetical protein
MLISVDQPGEWPRDRPTVVRTGQAAPGEHLNDHRFVAPHLNPWLVVSPERRFTPRA